MAKVALLIGVSEYEPGLNPLPSAAKDIKAMKQVLQHSEMGNFTESDIRVLKNPDRQVMEEAIEALFANRQKDDLVLLFFSGHGIKDDQGRLYLSTSKTRKNLQGELVRSTAVPANIVQESMSRSRSKRQVVILDCCFSGAFAEGMSAKDDGSVDVKSQLGGEGRAILTSSTSTQYSFEQQGSDLSVYTRYLIEGIETGAADQDNDGSISIDELHEYAKRKVQETAPAMSPEIYAVKEGFKILLAKASVGDPKLRYRKDVEQFASRGEISDIARTGLEAKRAKLGLLPEEAAAIEAEVVKPYQVYKQNLQQYEQEFDKAVKRLFPLSSETYNDLKFLQQALGLRNEDVAPIEQRIIQQQETGQLTDRASNASEAVEAKITALTSAPLPLAAHPPSLANFWSNNKYRLLVGAVAPLAVGVVSYFSVRVYIQFKSDQKVLNGAIKMQSDHKYLECIRLVDSVRSGFLVDSKANSVWGECDRSLTASKAKTEEQMARDKDILKSANTLSVNDRFVDAIKKAREISDHNVDAKNSIAQWCKQLLNRAKVRYNEGDLDEAVRIANSITTDTDTDTYSEAQKAISTWKSEWKRSEDSIQRSTQEINNSNLEMAKAIEAIKQVAPAYWTTAKTNKLPQKDSLRTAYNHIERWRNSFFEKISYSLIQNKPTDEEQVKYGKQLIYDADKLIDSITSNESSQAAAIQQEMRKEFNTISKIWKDSNTRYEKAQEACSPTPRENCLNLLDAVTDPPFKTWAEKLRDSVIRSQPTQATSSPKTDPLAPSYSQGGGGRSRN